MVFAISYSLLEGQLSRERIWPSVLHLCYDVSQKYIPQSEEFTDFTDIVISRCAPHSRCVLGSCHARLPLVPALASVPIYTDHVVLKPSLSDINQYRYVTGSVSAVVACWTHTLGIMGSNPCQVKPFFLSCSRHVILHKTKNCCIKVLYIPKIFCHTSLCGPIASGASVDPTSQICSFAMLVLLIV
jgi:hypothetical protein